MPNYKYTSGRVLSPSNFSKVKSLWLKPLSQGLSVLTLALGVSLVFTLPAQSDLSHSTNQSVSTISHASTSPLAPLTTKLSSIQQQIVTKEKVAQVKVVSAKTNSKKTINQATSVAKTINNSKLNNDHITNNDQTNNDHIANNDATTSVNKAQSAVTQAAQKARQAAQHPELQPALTNLHQINPLGTYNTKATDTAATNLLADTANLIGTTKVLTTEQRKALIAKQNLALLNYHFTTLYDGSNPLPPITSNASFDENKSYSKTALTYAHPINFEIYRQQHPVVEKKTLFSRLKELYTDLFGTVSNITITQDRQLPPLQFNNTLPSIFKVNYKYDRYIWNLFQKQGVVTITINGIKIIIKDLGNKELYQKYPDNLYTQAAQNVITAINLIAPINMDMSLRTQFKISKLVNNALQAYGLYNAQIQIKPTGKKELTLTIDPKKPVVMSGQSSLIIRGQGTGFPLYQDQSQSFINPKAVLSSAKYEDIKSRLTNIALDNGFFDGKFVQHDLFVNTYKNYAYWKLDFNTGTRYKINKIYFTGSQINTNLLANAISLKKDQYYSNNEISSSVSFLRSSQWFDAIAVDPKVNKETKTVDLEYKVIPIRPNSLKLSFGYDTFEGLRTKSQFDRHFINSYGGSFQNTLYLSKIKQSLVVNYKHPNFFDPLQQFMNFGFSLNREYQTNFNDFSRSLVLYANYTYVPHNNWQLSGTFSSRRDSWHYLDQRYHIALNYFDFNVARLSINTNFSLNLKSSYLFTKLFSSQLNYNSFSLKMGHMFNINQENAVNVNLRIAKIFTNNFYYVPPTLRLYSGGANSIRGYPYNSVSSYKGTTGIGGIATNDIQLEYLHQIYLQGLKGVLFLDAGQTSDKFRLNNLDFGAGIGVRYYLPVGFVNFDIAYPLKPHFKWRKISFYLGVTTQL